MTKTVWPDEPVTDPLARVVAARRKLMDAVAELEEAWFAYFKAFSEKKNK